MYLVKLASNTSSKRSLLCEHFSGQICLFLDKFSCELGPFVKFVADDLLHFDQLALFEVVQDFGIGVCSSALYSLQLLSTRIRY